MLVKLTTHFTRAFATLVLKMKNLSFNQVFTANDTFSGAFERSWRGFFLVLFVFVFVFVFVFFLPELIVIKHAQEGHVCFLGA